MQWLILGIGILFEVLGTVCMKYAEGFTKLWPSVLAFVFYGISLVVLVYVLDRMQISIAYAIWSSAGILLISFIGVYWFNEPMSLGKAISMSLIIIGIIGLDFFE